MPAVESTIVVALTFLVGFVKGVTGLGLPTVALAILTVALGLQPAMAILLAPSFATNVWQALAGGIAVASFVCDGLALLTRSRDACLAGRLTCLWPPPI